MKLAAVISILFMCVVFILPTQAQAAVLKRGSTGDKVSQMQQKLKIGAIIPEKWMEFLKQDRKRSTLLSAQKWSGGGWNSGAGYG